MEQSPTAYRLKRPQVYSAGCIFALVLVAIALIAFNVLLPALGLLFCASGLTLYLLVRLSADRPSVVSDVRLEPTLLKVLMSYLDTAEAAIAVDAQGTIMRLNDRARQLLNADGDVIGRSFDTFWGFRDKLNAPVSLFGGSAATVQRHEQLTRTIGSSSQLIDVIATPYYLDVLYDKPSGYIVVVRDITNRKDLDEEEEEFIALTSHELRTPLTIAEANLSLLLSQKEASFSTDVAQRLQNTYSTIRHLSEIVNDLTTLRHAQEGLLDVDLAQLEPRKVLEELAAQQQSVAADKGLQLVVDVAPGVHPVLTSGFRVTEIIQNYLINALKFTDKGSVTLRAVPAEGGGILFSVADTGRGISAADREKLFERFYQVGDFRTRREGGTGLGLYIVSQIARRLDAKVWCESQLGKGSIFYLQVPPYSRLGQDKGQVAAAAMDDLLSG